MRFKSLLILIIALKFGDVWKKACLTDSRDYKIGLGELFITFSDYDTRSADILQDLGLDTFEQRRSKQPAISVFKYLNNPYPEERVETNLQGSFLQRMRCLEQCFCT